MMERFQAYLDARWLEEELLKAHAIASVTEEGAAKYHDARAIAYLQKLAHTMGYRVEKIESWKPKVAKDRVDPRVDAVCQARPGWDTEHPANQEQIRAAVAKDLAVADAAMEAANG